MFMGVSFTNFIAYCKELLLEFKKIKAPSLKEAALMSCGVLFVVCAISLFLFLVDGLVLLLMNIIIFSPL